MAKTIKVTLGEQEYEVPRLIVEQVEDLADLSENTDEKGAPLDAHGNKLKGKALVSYTINLAAVVLRYATPTIANVRHLDCEIGELNEVAGKVLEFSRLKRSAPEGNGQAGAATPP